MHMLGCPVIFELVAHSEVVPGLLVLLASGWVRYIAGSLIRVVTPGASLARGGGCRCHRGISVVEASLSRSGVLLP